MSIRIIGCGAMGSAIAQALALGGKKITVYDINHERAQALAEAVGTVVSSSPLEGITSQDDLLLAVKPKDLQATASQLKGFEGRFVISILAGVSTTHLRAALPNCRILRMMPNLAVQYGEGITALAEDPIVSPFKKEIEELFSPLGWLHWIAEEHFDALTALTGSGPAFVCALLEAMIDGALAMGLPFNLSYDLIKEMIRGTLATLQASNKLPSDLKWQVTSPKGTTIYGLCTFEEKGVRSGIIETLLAAFERAQQL